MPSVDILLDAAGLTVEDLAERAKLAVARAEAIALGRWTPSPKERQRVADAFGVPIDEIIFGHMMDPRNVRYRRVGLEQDFQRRDDDPNE